MLLIGMLCIGLMLLSPGQALAAGAVFTPAPDMAADANNASASQPAKVLRARVVTVNTLLLFPETKGNATPDAAAALAFNLFDNMTVQVTPTRWETSSDGNTTIFVGQNDAAVGGESRIANTGGVLYGMIRTGGKLLYELLPAGGNAYLLREIDQTTYPDEKEALPPTPLPQLDPARTSSQRDDGSAIDVMMVYTAAARNAVGGTAAMASLINLAFSETNQGYANSGMVQRYRLVHAAEVSYDESSGFDDALSRLQNTSDGYMDEVHTLRDQYGADIVTLLIDNSDYCGLGYLMTSLSSDFAAWAFNVVSHSCATGYYSFAHECGHNQGAHHDRASTSGQGVYSYSYGYQQLSASPQFRTIMAYNCSGDGCERVNYWSNPEVSYNGYPTGVVSTAADSADNRMTLDNTRTTAANWRQAVAPKSSTTVAPQLLLLTN
ncbi:hypothetical protein DGI_1524 [Megalodesulfovibrio gigas DSM 1382 = ATCC 19364]|uniref:Peptidyl-Asp metalloendopeptidase n=1 Tax=Megalodesulfovibrio gigas (strain ATCC 19364 / DSM 1382 / NCIMB 9332 / VKM B-1759) TaxID=1121448 RepID=T2G9U4_MEGG1|nr:hypothetical protein DGI_1524 [Megalodesulfovibrio gigas DSM 1382 = ATCC 19364]